MVDLEWISGIQPMSATASCVENFCRFLDCSTLGVLIPTVDSSKAMKDLAGKYSHIK
jgi:hypothetical protein